MARQHLIVAMYGDATQLEANIIKWAGIVKDEVNVYIGRKTDFTVSELAETKNKPIIIGASQLTAAKMEIKRQEMSSEITEEAKNDKAEAYATLDKWMTWNGIEPPSSTRITELPIGFAEAGTYDA